MNDSRIAELLAPYIVGLDLPSGIYAQLSTYLGLLLRWNARTNLTAIRDPEQIVTRHFGESLFAAGVLFGRHPSLLDVSSRAEAAAATGAEGPAVRGLATNEDPVPDNRQQTTDNSLADLGSGAGFPGIPIKLAFPQLHVTLIESQNKKATFLKEVIRTLRLDGIEVYTGRAETWGKHAGVVTMRAVENFESALPVATSLVAPQGRLCLLVGGSFDSSSVHIGNLDWQTEVHVPGSESRRLLIARRT